MREDRLRALRGLRFTARFEFTLEPATWSAIKESAPHLNRLSAERVKQEIEKTLQQVARPSVAFSMWKASGAFASLVPILADADVHRFHVTDALPRPVLRTRPARKVIRLASLFIGHPTAQVRDTLRALRFSNADIDAVARISDGWLALSAEMALALTAAAAPSDGRIRRWVATTGRTQWTLIMRLAAAVWAAQRERGEAAPSARAVNAVYRRGVRIAFRDPIELADLAVDGDDLRTAGVPAGPAIGRVLARLLDAVVEDPGRNQRDVLLALAKETAS
jgi:tRNA nucleotidyltransferase (CCA-adding enzyme)